MIFLKAILSKAAGPMLFLAIGLVSGIGLQQRVLSREVKIDYDKIKIDYARVQTIVADEITKGIDEIPEPQPQQGLDFDKIRGRGHSFVIHQNYKINVDGDSLLAGEIGKIVEEKVKALKVSKCK